MKYIKQTIILAFFILISGCGSVPSKLYNPIEIRSNIRSQVKPPAIKYKINDIISIRMLQIYNNKLLLAVDVLNANMSFINSYINEYNKLQRTLS